MLYPNPLKEGSTIAITALSSGIAKKFEPRFEEIIKSLKYRGFNVVVGNCLHGVKKHVSASAEKRAKEFQKFLIDDSIDAIAPPWGGELAMEIIPLLDFELIKRSKPKWVLGFSDISTVTSVLTYKLNWATAHCSNLMDLIHTEKDPLISKTLNYLGTQKGDEFIQTSSKKHTRNWPKIDKNPLAILEGSIETKWKWLVKPETGQTLTGRLIGGCWDTLYHLFGTEYLNLEDLKSRYSEGFLLYLENAEMSPCNLVRTIFDMQFRGVFKSINGLLLGRSSCKDSEESTHLHYLEVLEQHLSNQGIPVVYDLDIGHVPPNLTLINGAIAELSISNDHGFIRQSLV